MTTSPARRVRLEEILEPLVDDNLASSYRGLALLKSTMQFVVDSSGYVLETRH